VDKLFKIHGLFHSQATFSSDLTKQAKIRSQPCKGQYRLSYYIL